MGKNKTHKEFIEELTEKNEAFRNGEFVVVGEYKKARTKLLLKDKYGEVMVCTRALLQGICPSIKNAIDKTSYVKNKFMEVHGDNYGYNKVVYRGATTNVEIYCNTHKEYFKQSPSSHLGSQGCPKCGKNRRGLKRRKKSSEFLQELTLKNKHFREGGFEIIGEYVTQNEELLIKTKYGNCKVLPSNLLAGKEPTILSAVDKTAFIIEKFREVLGDTVDYSKVSYIDSQTNVTLICPIHGDFYKQPNNIMQGQGCHHCSGASKIDNNSFLLRVEDKHKNKFSYPELNVSSNRDEIIVICPVHGQTTQIVCNHLAGSGCCECGKEASQEKQSKTREQFIKESKEINGTALTYDDVVYVNSSTKVIIGCRIHGLFSVTPDNHLSKRLGCPTCGTLRGADVRRLGRLTFIERANNVHNNQYNYDDVEYIDFNHEVNINCSVHGSFSQRVGVHLSGGGCRECAKEVQGWSDSKWEEAGRASKNFHSFKVYVIKCWDDEEIFYKIGKTFRKMKNRFKVNCKAMPYNYEVIKIFEDIENGVKISKLERHLLNSNISNKYIPINKFKGMFECFSKINKETLDFEIN